MQLPDLLRLRLVCKLWRAAFGAGVRALQLAATTWEAQGAFPDAPALQRVASAFPAATELLVEQAPYAVTVDGIMKPCTGSPTAQLLGDHQRHQRLDAVVCELLRLLAIESVRIRVVDPVDAGSGDERV